MTDAGAGDLPRSPAQGTVQANGEPPAAGDSVNKVPVVPGGLAAYDIQKPVGKGGYAVVYKAVRKNDGRVVAIKKVEVFEMSQKKRDRCLQEVTLLQQLNHPNIIQMVDAFIDENMLIIIFEWAPAGDLKRLIKKTGEAGKTLDEAAIWNFFAQITDALLYMHQHRIMHRDIKPANVLVGANGILKLGDLGLGRQLSEQTMEAFSKVGTPYYVSPEVVRGAGYDWKSDVWSMGCLLYELACLRSPFEMEGANLYDVFQKISKGEYSPLPADQFSAPLRSLVVRMLSVDPAKRPELEEVWGITKSIVESQSKTRQDVHSVSEDLYQQLLALESEVVQRMAVSSGRKPAAVAEPPYDTLRLLHPLYFAEPTCHPGATDAPEHQKRQLGAFLQVFCWLLHLNGKSELAQSIEEHVEHISVNRPRSRPRSGQQQLVRVNSKGKKVYTPTPPPPPASVPMCTNLLKGAEAVKKAAQNLGLSTEFTPVNAVATGYGRAVCALLQDALEQTMRKLQVKTREPVRPADQPAEEEMEEADGLNDMICDGDEANLIKAGPRNASGLQGGEDDEEEAYFHDAAAAERAAFSLSTTASSSHVEGPASSRGASTSRGGSRGSSRAAAAAVATSHVDPVAWRAELERLGPQLSRIKVSAHHAYGDWSQRWHKLKESLQALHTDSPGTAAVLQKVQGQVDSDLDRIGVTERRLNGDATGLLEQYRAARQRLTEVQRDVQQHEELVQIGHTAIQQISDQLEGVQSSIQERANSLDGSLQVRLIQDAIKNLHADIHKMDVQIGVVNHQLAARQRAHLQQQFLSGEPGGLSDEEM